MRRFLCFAVFSASLLYSVPVAIASDKFTLYDWNQIETQAERGNPRAIGLRDGYLAGVRDALRFYSKVSKTFPICWPKDHEIDMAVPLLENDADRHSNRNCVVRRIHNVHHHTDPVIKVDQRQYVGRIFFEGWGRRSVCNGEGVHSAGRSSVAPV